MTAINFGVGTIIGRRTDTTNPTPAFMGIMQDIQIDFDQTLKELMGQYKMAVDVAPANMKVTGKAKFAKIQANLMNDLMFGQTLTTAAGQTMAAGEAASIPATPGPYTVTVTHAATFKEDLGVFYASNGKQLTRVASAPATGQYSVVETTGVYTFAAADQGLAVTFYYTYTVTTLQQISMANQLLGVGPTFEVNIQESYTNNAGVTNQIFLKLNACRSSKLSLPFKNIDYTVQEFDFQAFADQSNNWGLLAMTE
jgi:hypothetical protein